MSTSTIVYEGEEVHIPDWIVDLDSFRRWAGSDEFPETGRICYLKGRVWVDMSKEQIFTHGLLKGEYTRVLSNVSRKAGFFFPDGLFLTHVAANISGKPDGTFLSQETLDEGLARLVEGEEGGFVELEGSPDMVLEIVSRSSQRKDTVVLPEAYWEAGIREYWLVNARKTPPRFDIFRHGSRGYVATKKQGGWLKSAVFGKSFRLVVNEDSAGRPKYTLEVQ